MKQYSVTFQPSGICVLVDAGTTLLQAQAKAGLLPDAPCGGKGTCGKCLVTVAGQSILACQSVVNRDMSVLLPRTEETSILTKGIRQFIQTDRAHRYGVAIDVGTTTIVAYLLDGQTGMLLADESCRNPQVRYGADVISRIEYAMQGGSEEIRACVIAALDQLVKGAAEKAKVPLEEITVAALVGNTAMHHLLLGIGTKTLVTPPYMPKVYQALELPAQNILPIQGTLRVLPNIAGFVGGDTVGCMVATRFDKLEDLTLMIDIGTNGEMVLGDKHRRIACSTAAGPAFEGAKISCGMRGAAGAVDHVWVEDGEIKYHVIGEKAAMGLCGSGLLDLVAVLLSGGVLEESGYLNNREFTLCEGVTLTQKDVREVQLAKAAIRAGIKLLAQRLDVAVQDIRRVYLAGAFGNYLDPAAACRIGMIPAILQNRIQPIGNAAGEGAKLCAMSEGEFRYAQRMAENTEFLELASLPQFQDCYVDALEFGEEEP